MQGYHDTVQSLIDILMSTLLLRMSSSRPLNVDDRQHAQLRHAAGVCTEVLSDRVVTRMTIVNQKNFHKQNGVRLYAHNTDWCIGRSAGQVCGGHCTQPWQTMRQQAGARTSCDCELYRRRFGQG